MDKENEFIEWTSSEMGYNVVEGRRIYSKLKHGCGENLWGHTVNHTRNVRQKNMVAAFYLLGNEQTKTGKSDSDDLNALRQNKRSLEAEVVRVEKEENEIASLLTEKEDELKRSRRHCRSLEHKAFLLDRHHDLTELTIEKYSNLRSTVDRYRSEISQRRKSTGTSQLFMLGDSSPLKETHVYRNIECTIDYRAEQLSNESCSDTEDETKTQLGDELEVEVHNMMMNFCVADILQSIKVHAKSTMDFEDQRDDLDNAEKKVTVERKSFDESFQEARDKYISLFFEIQNKKRKMVEYDNKIEVALKDHDAKLDSIFANDVEGLQLSKNLARLDLKCIMQKEAILCLKEMSKQVEECGKANESRRLVTAVGKDLCESESALSEKRAKISQACHHNSKLIETICEKLKKFRIFHESVCSRYRTETKPLFLSIGDHVNTELDVFAKLKIENMLVTKVREKQIRVFDLSVHNENKTRAMKDITTAVQMQPFHANETLLQKAVTTFLNAKDDDAFIESQIESGKYAKESLLKMKSYRTGYADFLQKHQLDQKCELIPLISKHVLRTDSAILMCKNIEENISSCYNWDEASVTRILESLKEQ